MPTRSTILPLEYDSLRQELAQNKQYVFERPLLIVTAFFLGMTKLDERSLLTILPLILILMLALNLVLTFNRLNSSSRIIAYIGLFLESSDQTGWIGWEISLRKYRIWINEHKSKINDILKNNLNPRAIPDSYFFYGPLLAFHVIMILLALSTSLYLFYEARTIWNILWLILSALSTGIFFILIYTRYTITKASRMVEEQRIIWHYVFNIPLS